MNIVTKAIKSRGLTPLAREIGISHQALRKWEAGKVPPNRVKQFAEITGYPKEVIRPDIFA